MNAMQNTKKNVLAVTNIDMTSIHPIYTYHIDNPKKPVKFVYIHDWRPSLPLNFIGPLKDDDFIFTILRNPIHQLYSIYYHMKSKLEDSADEIQTTNQHFDIYHRMILTSHSIIMFIDWILDFGYIFKYFILPKGFFNPDTLSKMHFVGIHEHLPETLVKLKEMTGIELNVPHVNDVQYTKDYKYRYDELCDFFKEEFNVYNHYLERFRASANII